MAEEKSKTPEFDALKALIKKIGDTKKLVIAPLTKTVEENGKKKEVPMTGSEIGAVFTDAYKNAFAGYIGAKEPNRVMALTKTYSFPFQEAIGKYHSSENPGAEEYSALAKASQVVDGPIEIVKTLIPEGELKELGIKVEFSRGDIESKLIEAINQKLAL